MSGKQKLIVAVLAIANTVLILALARLMLRPFDAVTSPLPTPWIEASALPPVSEGATASLPHEVCRWEAAQMLAQAGLAGTAALASDGSLCFEITRSLPPGAEADSAAQSIWTAFDVVLVLQERDCAFTQIEVTVLARGDQSDVRAEASVGAADLAAFGAGELSEDEFIERVTYTILVQ